MILQGRVIFRNATSCDSRSDCMVFKTMMLDEMIQWVDMGEAMAESRGNNFTDGGEEEPAKEPSGEIRGDLASHTVVLESISRKG